MIMLLLLKMNKMSESITGEMRIGDDDDDKMQILGFDGDGNCIVGGNGKDDRRRF